MELRVELDNMKVPYIEAGKYTLRLDLEDLDGHYKERATKELREQPEIVEEAIANFRKLIQDEPNFNIPIDDESFLLKFLRPCKYYTESAFRLLRKFYKFKVKHPKICLDLTPNLVRKVFDAEVFQFLPTRSSTGGRIMIVNAGTKWNPKEITLEDMFRAVMVAIEIAMLEPKTQIGGVHVIINVQGLSLIHVYEFSPSTAKMIVDWVQECTPVRLKGIHLINQPFIFDMVYAIFRPFLGDKLKKRIFFHGSNRKNLCERIGKDSLPSSLGGTAEYPDIPGRLLSDMLYYYNDDFEKYESYGYVREEKA